MVQHLVVAAKIRVLVGQRVQAMRTLRNDLTNTESVHRFDVLFGQHLEQVLIPRTAGGIPRTGLLWTERRE